MLGDRQRHPWAAAISWQSVARPADRINEAIKSRTRGKNASNHNQHYLFPRPPPATSEGAPLYLDRSTDVSAQWRTITMTRALLRPRLHAASHKCIEMWITDVGDSMRTTARAAFAILA